MIQEISPHQFANEFQPCAPTADSYVLFYDERKVLARISEEEIEFPTFGELSDDNKDIYDDYTYLFSIDDARYYLVSNLNYDNVAFEMEKFERMRDCLPLHKAFAGVTGSQLYRWYHDHKFCGRCGKSTKPDNKERMLRCVSCDNVVYPRIMPAVIVGVIDGNRIVMSKYANRYYSNYALLAGYVEIGETLGAAIRREIMEEVGLKVKNIRYYRSQPWGFSDSLLMGFYADLDGDDTITIDEHELSEAAWFEREDIPVKEHNLSLTNEMIMQFKKGLV